MKTMKEYWRAIKEIVTNPGRAGGEDNTPTVTPKPGVKVDDGNVGNDNNIDKPTPVSPPAKGSDGTPISSEPAGEWEGPPD